ncbi:MAG: hypothetical protein ACR2OZ_10615 [Verrucomicrobiales bacterium]
MLSFSQYHLKILASFLPLVLGGVVYSRGVSAEMRSAIGSDGVKLFRGVVLALLLVTVSILIQIFWVRDLWLYSTLAVLLISLVTLEFAFPSPRGLDKSRFFVAVGIGLFVAISCGIALILSVLFEGLGSARP